MPARCEVEDFISCGLEALIHSIDRYDPEKGATLEQYAWTRIHGAVLDELRRQDWAPRSVRRWERDIEKRRRRSPAPRPPADARRAGRRRSAPPSTSCASRRDEIAPSDLTSLNTLVLADDRDDDRARRHHRRRRRLDGPAARRRPERGQGPLPRRLRPPAAPRARGRRPALRQGHDAGRDRRDPRRLREPRLPDPHGELKKTLRSALDDDEPLFARSRSDHPDRTPVAVRRPRSDAGPSCVRGRTSCCRRRWRRCADEAAYAAGDVSR